MGRPTTTRKYHSFFWEVLDKLKTRDKVSFRYQTLREAKNVQLDFLAFRTAAVKERLDQPHTVPNPENMFKPEDFYPAQYPELNAYKTRVRQVDGVFWLDIYHMDTDELTITMRQQLDAME